MFLPDCQHPLLGIKTTNSGLKFKYDLSVAQLSSPVKQGNVIFLTSGSVVLEKLRSLTSCYNNKSDI